MDQRLINVTIDIIDTNSDANNDNIQSLVCQAIMSNDIFDPDTKSDLIVKAMESDALYQMQTLLLNDYTKKKLTSLHEHASTILNDLNAKLRPHQERAAKSAKTLELEQQRIYVTKCITANENNAMFKDWHNTGKELLQKIDEDLTKEERLRTQCCDILACQINNIIKSIGTSIDTLKGDEKCMFMKTKEYMEDYNACMNVLKEKLKRDSNGAFYNFSDDKGMLKKLIPCIKNGKHLLPANIMFTDKDCDRDCYWRIATVMSYLGYEQNQKRSRNIANWYPMEVKGIRYYDQVSDNLTQFSYIMPK